MRLTLVIPFLAFAAQAAAQNLVITNATVIDGVAAEPMRNASVVIRDGRIERFATGAVAAPAGATVIDLKGA